MNASLKKNFFAVVPEDLFGHRNFSGKNWSQCLVEWITVISIMPEGDNRVHTGRPDGRVYPGNEAHYNSK